MSISAFVEKGRAMKASWKIEKTERGGLLGSKTRFNVFAKISLSAEEAATVAEYAPYDPPVTDFFEPPEDMSKKMGYKRASSYQEGCTIEAESIQSAGKYKDAVIEAFEAYKSQIDATASRARSLGSLHEIDL
jgi:hypothetical protein